MKDKKLKTVLGMVLGDDLTCKLMVEYDWIDIDKVTAEEFACICVENGDYSNAIGLTLEETIELRNHLTKMIDNYILNMEYKKEEL